MRSGFTIAATLSVAALLAGCSSSTINVGTTVLPTSNRAIDVVQHRTDGKGCTTGFVLQTYDAAGALIDSKGGFGRSLGCATVDGLIRAGGTVGAASLIADGIRNSGDRNTFNNSNSQAQGQLQGQKQHQNQGQGQNQNQNQTAEGGQGGEGGHGGNNGGGNGNNDGTNPGTEHGGGHSGDQD